MDNDCCDNVVLLMVSFAVDDLFLSLPVLPWTVHAFFSRFLIRFRFVSQLTVSFVCGLVSVVWTHATATQAVSSTYVLATGLRPKAHPILVLLPEHLPERETRPNRDRARTPRTPQTRSNPEVDTRRAATQPPP
jgi:hypothetical protein